MNLRALILILVTATTALAAEKKALPPIEELLSQGEVDKAFEAARDAVSEAEKSTNPGEESRAMAMEDLARVCEVRHDFLEAEVQYRKIINELSVPHRPTNPIIARCQLRLGLICQAQGRQDEAKVMMERSLKNRIDSVGTRHPDYAASLLGVASTDYFAGSYPAAEERIRESLAVRTAALGEEHVDVATSLHALAAVLASQGKHVEAEKVGRRALEMRRKLLGPTDPELALTLSNQAEILRVLGKRPEVPEAPLKEAIEYSQQSLSIWEKQPEGVLQAARAAKKLAALYVTNQEKEKAVSLLRQALEAREKADGPNHPKVAEYLHSLGEILVMTGSPRTESRPLFERAAKIMQESRLNPTLPATYWVTPSLPFSHDEVVRGPTPEASPGTPPVAR